MNIPEKYINIWQKAEPLLKQGRPGDDAHALEVVNFILENVDPTTFDILIPTGIMHDIGHSAILPEHFKYITGQEKVGNGKLVHMLAGAKIAKEILDAVDYDKEKTTEIVDLISMHDADQLDNVDIQKVYNTDNKKLFHDIDCMDRYNAERLKNFENFSDKNRLMKMLEKGLDSFFYPKFRQIAEERFKKLIV